MPKAITLTMPAQPLGRMEFLTGLMLRLRAYPPEQYDITISRHIERRSLSQNAMLWGLIYPGIRAQGGETLAGWTEHELHEYFLGEHFGWERFKLRPEDELPIYMPRRRSSRLSTKEFTEFVDFIVRRCAEIGIVLRLPEDRDAQSPQSDPPAEPR